MRGSALGNGLMSPLTNVHMPGRRSGMQVLAYQPPYVVSTLAERALHVDNSGKNAYSVIYNICGRFPPLRSLLAVVLATKKGQK